ncbi:MAG: hypothetical protein H7Y59_03950 [Anaerolineales bacterium]|nr:hypothetical protein [Anaerolineales bacterium]
MKFKKMLVLLGMILVIGAILAACSGNETTPAPDATAAPVVAPIPDTPYLAEWQGSGHADIASEPFRHWDAEDPAEVPTTCAKCHTSDGYRDFLGADGSEAGTVDIAVAADHAQGVQCIACHNAVTISKTSVVFPSGVEIKNIGDDARCMECHQGRESKVSVDAQIEKFAITDMDAIVAPIKDEQGEDVRFGFRNVHYYAAAATLYGGMTHGGYEYEGKTYDAKNTHVEGYATCTGCHDPHTLEVKINECANCHEDVATVEDLKNVRMVSSNPDYDGDGDAQEGMFYEIESLQATLMAEIQKYAKDTAGTGIVYDAAAYPYWFADADGDGAADQGDNGSVGYNTWTARLLKAAYNYQVSLKDPGAFAHGNKYIVQLIYDSVEDLGGDTSTLVRTDAGHFAGDTLPFRDWDFTEDGEPNYVVPFGCVKCHTAQGLPTFIKDGGTTVVTSTGTTSTTGVQSLPSSNGFLCSTCHNTEAFPERYTVASVVFPSGKSVSFGGKDADGNFIADDSNLCISCHMGRESTTSVNSALRGKEDDTVDAKIRFKNIHYFAAGATIFGGEVQGAYTYAGKEYVGQNMHASEEGKMNKCQDCHDVHALEPKIETCETCHNTTDPTTIRETDVDYDGDGDITEGIKGEVDTLAEALLAQLQMYAAANGGAIKYDTVAYPYFFGADDKAYAAWTPRLLRAAFNYQYSQKDPGAYVHNPKFVIQFLIDSIEDLGGDVSTYTRP